MSVMVVAHAYNSRNWEMEIGESTTNSMLVSDIVTYVKEQSPVASGTTRKFPSNARQKTMINF